MFGFSDISTYEAQKEKYKILKSLWNVIAEYLVVFLAMLAIVFGGMQVTSGSFECLPAVDCPGITKSNRSSTLMSEMKYHNVCQAFYSSQKTNTIKRTDVVTDLKSNLQYTNFVKSECSKIALPNFLSYFWFVLFTEAFVLIVLDNLWLKLPITASVIEDFVSLVMDCYTSPFPNFLSTQAQSGMQGTHNADDDINILKDAATISAVKTLYEKVQTFKENVESTHKRVKIWQLYLIQSIFQVFLTFIFFAVDIYYLKDLKEIMTCKLTQYIPVTHDYFICSHNLAPTYSLGLKLIYLPALALALLCFMFTMAWTFLTRAKSFEYDFEEEKLPSQIGHMIDIVLVNEDFGFLLHLLHSYNKLYVVRFAHFLSEKNKKKLQSFQPKNHALDEDQAVPGQRIYESVNEVYDHLYQQLPVFMNRAPCRRSSFP